MWFWFVRHVHLYLIVVIWRNMDGRFASMMHKICVAVLDFAKMELSNWLLDHKKNHNKPSGMVIVVYHLQSSRKHGGKLLFEKHLPRHPPDTCPDMKNRNLKSASVHHVDNNAAGRSHAITGDFLHLCCTSVCGTSGQDSWRWRRGWTTIANSGLTEWKIHWALTWRRSRRLPQTWLADNSIIFLIWTCGIFVRILRARLMMILMFVKRQRMLVIVVCLLSLSTVLSTSVNSFFDDDIAQNFEHNYSVAELLFHLTNGILLLREKDAGSHCPSLVTIEPSDMSKQEKKAFLTDESKKQNADARKEAQKARKAKGKG